MAMEVGEPFPSFSTERIRSRMHTQDGPATQRRLDYNAPLLSVRRLVDANGDRSSKVWKLSAELSKEPFSVRGAVPFTWEHSPGRPKQPESAAEEVPLEPPRTPGSPSPPSTPSPPSVRRASPASPPPPPLRPLFLRSESSTLFAPPPPPPPPPPPLSYTHTPATISRRASPSPHPPAPPPPPPPLHNRTFVPASSKAVHERVQGFRMVDPTEDLLRAIRARREKLEREASPSRLADEASESTRQEVRVLVESSHGDPNCLKSISENAHVADSRGRGVVDAIVKRFLEDHPDACAEEEARRDKQDGDAQEANSQVVLEATDCKAVSSEGSICNEAAKHHSKHMLTDESDPCIHDKVVEQITPALSVCPNNGTETQVDTHTPEIPHQECPSVFERGDPEPLTASVSAQPLTEAMEVQTEAGHEQISVSDRKHNKRRANSIAFLDSCRVESLWMMKGVVMQLCRKVAAASLQTLSRARRKVTPLCRDSSFLDVILHHKVASTPNGTGSCEKEKAVVLRDMEDIIHPARLSQERELEVQVHVLSPAPSSNALQGPAADIHDQRCVKATEKQDRAPLVSPKFTGDSQENSICIGKMDDTFCVPPPPPSPPPLPPPSPHSVLSRKQSLDLELVEENPSATDTIEAMPSTEPIVTHESPDLPSITSKAVLDPRPSFRSSVRHVYSKSLGGDEPNEFYDASSRFGSRSSTPSHVYSKRSMSRDWANSEEFLDATSTPFETPRTSVSESRYSFSVSSPSTAFRAGTTNRPTSKLSKRVGKALWVDTRDIYSTEKVDALCSSPVKQFYSGELFSASYTTPKAPNKVEPQCTQRKCVSGDQASSSTSQARRQNKRDMLTTNAKSGTTVLAAVTPVFPSKCQKNRMIASTSGLPCQISTENMQDVGWPLRLSGYPPLKISVKQKAESKLTKKGLNGVVVPSPPLPPSPAGGSWLRKALSSNALNQQAPSRLAGLQGSAVSACKKPSSPNKHKPNSPNNKWEDIVKGSQSSQPGHLRFSEELHHHPPASSSNKYYVS